MTFQVTSNMMVRDKQGEIIEGADVSADAVYLLSTLLPNPTHPKPLKPLACAFGARSQPPMFPSRMRSRRSFMSAPCDATLKSWTPSWPGPPMNSARLPRRRCSSENYRQKHPHQWVEADSTGVPLLQRLYIVDCVHTLDISRQSSTGTRIPLACMQVRAG